MQDISHLQGLNQESERHTQKWSIFSDKNTEEF
jgi:hypothetical protein